MKDNTSRIAKLQSELAELRKRESELVEEIMGLWKELTDGQSAANDE